MSTTISSLSPIIELDGSSVITSMNRINSIKDVDGNISTTLSKDLEASGSLHDVVYVTKKVTLENSALLSKFSLMVSENKELISRYSSNLREMMRLMISIYSDTLKFLLQVIHYLLLMVISLNHLNLNPLVYQRTRSLQLNLL